MSEIFEFLTNYLKKISQSSSIIKINLTYITSVRNNNSLAHFRQIIFSLFKIV